MSYTKQQRETRQIEMVETHNIALSLVRMGNALGYGVNDRRKRAIYHAVCMTDSFNNEERKNLRIALNLP